MQRLEATRLVEANQEVTQLLLEGTTVTGLPDWQGGRAQRVRYIDWDHPDHNDFLVINQFRVDEPGGQAKKFVVPDAVLFVNGIPLVVIECKSPGITEPMAEAITQLRRYANQRRLGLPEGNEQLFWTNQFVVGTHYDHARVGTFTADPDQYLEWKDAAPLSKEELARSLDKSVPDIASQELLVAGLLKPDSLLDIVRHFTLFMEADGRTVKAICRYQQYRAVRKAIIRLTNGATRNKDGESDRRGGIIWHTQGSGKSLTMVFLVKAMRSDPELRRFKVVVVTDRKDLEKQLKGTAELSGEVIKKPRTASSLRKVLAQKGPGMVFAKIQKYRDVETPNGAADDLIGKMSAKVVNEDESILVLIDEAHRSHTSTLHANLLRALPNCVRIGFTGTPIMRHDKQRTEAIFGDFIDQYTIRQSEADRATLPILYEGRTSKGAVRGGSDLDQLFEDMFVEHTSEEIEALKRRYATTGNVMEAPGLIAAKARNMLTHYISSVMPGSFKAQVVASSRLAAVRYRDAFIEGRDELVRDIESLPKSVIADYQSGILDIDARDRREQLLIRAHGHLPLIRDLQFVPVISGGNNDPGEWAQWTDGKRQEDHIERFKKALGPQTKDSDPIAFLIVKSMLLTGFDAPVEQALYLDRFIQDAELLQAVARVNRTAEGKQAGLIIDYFGVGSHLQTALAAYAPEDAEDVVGVLQSIKDELPRLADRHARVVAMFAQLGIEEFASEANIEACIQALADERLRANFDVALRQFLSTLDIVLPRPEALPYVKDAKQFGTIQLRVRRRYRDGDLGDFDPSLYGQKVRTLIDEHVTVLDLSSRIPPVSITAPDFLQRVSGLVSEEAKASEMEHALRYHIRKHFDEDPARYTKLSERLDEILGELTERWDQLILTLTQLIEDTRESTSEEQRGLDPAVARFVGLLESELARDAILTDDQQRNLVPIAEQLVSRLRKHLRRVGYWQNLHAQEETRRWVVTFLDERDLYELDELASIADRVLDLAKANHSLLVGGRDE